MVETTVLATRNQKVGELKLIKQAIKGKRQAQNDLYKLYYAYVYSIAMRYSSTTEETQEITHDAFLKVFSNLNKYDFEQSFKPWVRRLTINVAIDYYRKYQSVPKNMELIESDETVENDALDHLSAEELLKLISKLSPRYRITFSLYVVEGFKHEEIAKQLGITVGASKANLSKAKANLRKMISSDLKVKKYSIND